MQYGSKTLRQQVFGQGHFLPRPRLHHRVSVSSFTKTSAYRRNVIVHNESARGFDRNEPRPTYSTQKGSRSDERRRYRWTQNDETTRPYISNPGGVYEEGGCSAPKCPLSIADLRPEASPKRNTARKSVSPKALVHQLSRTESCHERLPEIKEVQEDESSTSSSPTPLSETSTTSTDSGVSEHQREIFSHSSQPDHQVIASTNHSSQILRHREATSRDSSLRAVSQSTLASLEVFEHDDPFTGSSPSTSTAATFPHPTHIDDSEPVASSLNDSSPSEIDSALNVARRSGRFTANCQPEEEVDIYDWASESSFVSEQKSESILTYASSIPSIYPPLTNPNAGNGGRLLPCEFSRYALCTEWFHAEDTHTWVEHIITDHLRNNIPSKCCCWFCDDYKFDVAQTGVDQYTNFMWRMEHIREHLVGDGYTVGRSRPDYDFLDHLWNEKLISKATFDAARSWQDGPPPRVKGLYAYNFEPAESLRVREKSKWIPVDQKREDRERKRSRSSNHKMPQSKIRNRSRQSSRATNACSESPFNHPSGQLQDKSNQTTSPSPDRLRKSFKSRRKSQGPSAPLDDSDTNKQPQNSQQELEHNLGMLAISGKHVAKEDSKAVEVDNTAGVHVVSGKPHPNTSRSPEAAQRVRKKRSIVLLDERKSTELSQRIHLAAQKLVGSLPLRNLAPTCGSREHTNVSSGQSSSNASSSRGGSESSQLAPRSRQSVQPKKKRKFSQEPNDGDSDEEQVQSRFSKGKEKEGQSLACPFYKHDRLRYGNRRYCNGPGWADMHRLKEHLYRKHRQEKHCCRCWTTFKEDGALTAHQRAQPPCDVLDEVPIDGLTATQEQQLKSRKAFSRLTEFEKWRKAYMILFPDVTEDQVPSCYYEPQEFQDSLADARFQAHLRQGLTPHLVNALMKQVKAMYGDASSGQAEKCCEKAVEEALGEWLPDAHAPMQNQTAMSTHLSDALGTTTRDSPQISIEQTESSTSRSTSESAVTDLARDPFVPLSDGSYGQLMEDSVFEFLLDSFQGWDQNDPDMLLGSSDGFQQYAGVKKPTSDSGYGSIPDQAFHSWLPR